MQRSMARRRSAPSAGHTGLTGPALDPVKLLAMREFAEVVKLVAQSRKPKAELASPSVVGAPALDAPAAARKRVHLSSRADRPEAAYLCAAQAYMLISIPTDTSTIFGAFQAIRTSLSFCVAVRAFEIRTGIDVTQVFTASDDDM
jgi:hypothetical protein